MTLCIENKDCEHYEQCRKLIPSALLSAEIEKCKYYTINKPLQVSLLDKNESDKQ